MKILIISIPLISSLSILTLGRYIGYKGGEIISKSSIIISMIISGKALIEYLQGQIYIINIKEWFNIGGLLGKIDIIFDKESVIMINLISIITLIIIYYSYWYLNTDPHINRFISLLLIFSVTMYILVLSNNFLFTFFGWEGVGIISFLLINFWSNSIQNSKSALKAIIFNKIGDIFFLMAMMIMSIWYYSLDYLYINSYIYNLTTNSSELLSLISLSLIFAAMAKSAQIFLHTWLGDAMAGPTPVSALLHAATMVTAGIFIILRSKVIIYNSLELIQSLILIIGSLTILFAGISSLNQYDIKKIIAFSTCGQIGFMFFALGMFQPNDSSLYHLITHGFFKALLFLSAGLLIHSFLYDQDLRKYGNFLFNSPLFYLFFFFGSLAIIAFPPFSGFYSKDLILLHSLSYPYYYFIILFIGSLFSSLYSFKILFFSFFNSSPLSTPLNSFHYLSSYNFLIPFIFLLLGSMFLGYFSLSLFSSPENINVSLESSFSSYFFIKFIPFTLPFIAFFLFFLEKNNFSNYFFSSFLSKLFPIGSRKFFFDNFYNYFFVKPSFFLSYHLTYKFIDRGFLEFFGPISLFRLFFYVPNTFSLSSQSSTNTPYLFYYFFLSLFIIFFPFLLYSSYSL